MTDPASSTMETGAPERTRAGRTIGGLAWSTAGYAAQGISQLILLAVLGRLLTPVDFGVVTATLVIINLGRVATHGVISAAVVQRPTLADGHIRAAFALSLASGLVAAAAMVPLAPVAAAFFDMPQLVSLIRALSALFVIHAVGTVAEGLLLRDLDFRPVALAEGGGHAVGLAGAGVVAGLLGAGVWSLVIGYLGLAVVQTGILVAVRRHPVGRDFSRQEIGELVWYGGGLLGGRTFNYLAVQGDNLVVARTLSAGALGAYGRAYQLIAMPAMLIGQALDRVLLPLFARVQTERARLTADYGRAVTLVLLVTAPATVVMVVCAEDIIEVMLGRGWGAAVTPFRVLSAGLAARTAYKVSDTLARATGAVYGRAARQAAYAAMVLAGAGIGQVWGLSGVAVGVTVAIVGNHLLMFQLCRRQVDLGWARFGRLHVRLVVAAIVLAPIALGVRFLASLALPSIVVLAAVTAVVAGVVAAASFVWPLQATAELRWLLDQVKRSRAGAVAS